MKTKYIILLGVVGVGAVGAYMFFTRKQRQTAMLQQKGLEIVNIASTTPSTTPSTTSSATTPTLATQSDGVSPSDANLNLANATILVAEISAIDKEYATPFRGETKIIGSVGWGGDGFNETPEYKAYNRMRATYKIRREPKVTALAKLGYKLNATGALVKI